MLRSLRIENLVLIREAELAFAPGLNAITGETGAGKTILAQAVGLLLGAKGDAGDVGPAAPEAYVEAELDLADGLLEEEGLETLAELRPRDEDGIVLARRISSEGRTRAYAWGRSVAREDLAALGERLIAMSGQFQQRRLARPSYQLEVLDAFAGEEQLRRRAEAREAWRELSAARERHADAVRGAAASESRLAELRRLVEDTQGMEPGAEEELRLERERLRRVSELVLAAATAAEALAPEDGEGAAELLALAERAITPVEELAGELKTAGEELRDVEVRVRETAGALRSFLASLAAEPDRLDLVEAELDRIADAKRRFRCASYEELLARAEDARAELEALEGGLDPVAAAADALAAAEASMHELAAALAEGRHAAAPAFSAAVSQELQALGLGGAEFVAEVRRARVGMTGGDEVGFLIRANPGLPFAPVAETASGGELSRIALAIAAVAGGRTMIFDEIDAGIGGRTAHAVGDALRRLAERAQVITITHLPQIASLAERHFRVEKIPGDPTHTRIELLEQDERRVELERMLGGHEFVALLSGGKSSR